MGNRQPFFTGKRKRWSATKKLSTYSRFFGKNAKKAAVGEYDDCTPGPSISANQDSFTGEVQQADSPKYKVPRARRIFKCKICHSEFREKLQRDEHLKTHESKFLRVCRICNKSVLYVDWCQDHYHLARRTCKQCGTVFQQKKMLYKHRILVHGRRIFKCRICHSDFTEKSQRDEHLKTHPGQQCTICDVVLELHEDLECHMQHHKKGKSCFVCREVFPSQSDLKAHLRTSHEISCTKCGRKFHTEDDYGRHNMEGTKHKCEICCQRFRSSPNLQSHMESHFPKPKKPRYTKVQQSEAAELDVSSSDVTSIIKVEIPDEENSEFDQEKSSDVTSRPTIIKVEIPDEENSELNEEKTSPAAIKTEIVTEDPNFRSRLRLVWALMAGRTTSGREDDWASRRLNEFDKEKNIIKVENADNEGNSGFYEEKVSPVAIKTEIIEEDTDEVFRSQP